MGYPLHRRFMRGDKRPMPKSSALETCYTGQFTLSTQLIKPDYLHLKKKIMWTATHE